MRWPLSPPGLIFRDSPLHPLDEYETVYVQIRQWVSGPYSAAIKGKSLAFIYISTGSTLTIKPGAINVPKVKACWFDPRTGNSTLIGEYENKGEREFKVPGMSKELSWLKSGRGCDWVLVLDDAAKGFTEPGK